MRLVLSFTPVLMLLTVLVGCGPSTPAPPDVWPSVKPHLESLDRQADKARDRRIAELHSFFKARSAGSKQFAEDATSWRGEWALIKGTVSDKLGIGEGGDHAKYLAEAFAKRIFSSADLKAELERIVIGYLSELDGTEAEELVKLKADLADSELGRSKPMPKLQTDTAFLAECRRLEAELLPTLSRELGITVGRETISFFAMDIATGIIMHVAEAAAIEMGVSATVLSSGLVSGVATLGVGLVVGIVIDSLLKDLLRVLGYDPEADIARQLEQRLARFEGLLIDGDKEAWQAHDRLVRMARDDWSDTVRVACRKAADRIERGGQLGLRWELAQQQRLRAKAREAALRKFVAEGGAQ